MILPAPVQEKNNPDKEAMMHAKVTREWPYALGRFQAGLAITRLCLVLLTLGLFVQPRATQAQGQVNSIIAVVNGDVVTRSEIDSRRRLLALSSGLSADTGSQGNDQILRLLIDERLRIQELSRRRVAVTDQDIASSVANIESRNGLPPGGVRENLRRAGIEPFAWVINQSFAFTGTQDPLLVRRGTNELPYLAEVTGKLAHRTVLLPWSAEEPVGPSALAALLHSNHTSPANL